MFVGLVRLRLHRGSRRQERGTRSKINLGVPVPRLLFLNPTCSYLIVICENLFVGHVPFSHIKIAMRFCFVILLTKEFKLANIPVNLFFLPKCLQKSAYMKITRP